MKTVRAAVAVIAAITAPALAQPAVAGKASIKPWFDAAKTARVDMVMIGDSNQLFNGTGWDHGWTKALVEKYPLYASGLMSGGENEGNGSGMGYLCYEFGTIGQGFSYKGAPDKLDSYLPGGTEMRPLNYAYVPEGKTVSTFTNTGVVLLSASPLDVNAKLRMSLVYGTFISQDPGSFRLSIRLQQSPYTTLVNGAKVTTNTGVESVKGAQLDLPAGSRNADLNFKWTPTGGNGVQDIDGPFIAYYTRVENLDRPTGVSAHTLYGYGGQSARDMAVALQDAPFNNLSVYFAQVRKLQGATKRVLIRVNTGVNDLNENLPSVGPNPQQIGNSPEAYADNLQAIIDRVNEVWKLAAWPTTELYFLISTSHPIANPDTPLLIQYRGAADGVAMANPRTASVHFDRLTTATEMQNKNWYYSGNDHFHLSQAGYENLPKLELNAILSCVADFDESGALDIDDFIMYQTLFGAGDGAADLDDSGSLDIDDFIEFQSAFGLGCG